jgi:hypothetical protein
MPLRSAWQAVGLPEKDYRIKSINGTNVSDRTSILQEVAKVAIGEPITFILERSGGYSHNPLRGKNAPYHKQSFAPCDEFPLTLSLRTQLRSKTHTPNLHTHRLIQVRK